MSKINFFALGGVQEDGKNLYVAEIDEKIYIMDCGNKMPTADLHGVDIVINDYTYLLENRDRIVGLFLSHAHQDHIGGVSHLITKLKNGNKDAGIDEAPDFKLDIYASNFTLAVLKDRLEDDKVKYPEELLHVVTSRSKLEFGNVEIRFFEVSHNIPECLGIAIKTEDGYLIYTANYNFDQNSKIDYAHMFKSLAIFAKDKVIALFTESLGAMNEQSRGTILEFKLRLTNIITQTHNRIIFSLFSSDILRIQQIVRIALENNKKVAVIGVKTQKLVKEAINLGYLPGDAFVSLRYIDDKNKNNDEDLVVLVTGERHEPYFMLQRMTKGIDRLIHLEKNDTVVVLTNPVLGTEKMASKTLDIIYHVTSNVKTFGSNLLLSPDANREEIKEMINILKPRFIIPVIGEYRHQYALSTVANCVGYDDKHILILDCGDIITFENGKYKGITGEVVCGEVLIDGKELKDVSDVVMRDRELLSNDGLILISASINPRTKSVIVGPEIVAKGFSFSKDGEDMEKAIKQLFYLVSSKYLITKFINWAEFKNAIKTEVSHYVYKEIKRSPIIIPVLISTDVDAINQQAKAIEQ